MSSAAKRVQRVQRALEIERERAARGDRFAPSVAEAIELLSGAARYNVPRGPAQRTIRRERGRRRFYEYDAIAARGDRGAARFVDSIEVVASVSEMRAARAGGGAP